MAMMDDAGFLITHIRNCFITSDDTGMCEIVLETDENDNFEKKSTRKYVFSVKLDILLLYGL